ncbi:mitochondrial transcription rescue factor 1 isoform X3 [Monomorium pharaonis]|uniref:mitochondrial transcription rescue factor 1 isoform X3 n=1 Tax=Monomorium pharaonis TaxID=307658 RepID=UPI00063FC5B3|nr:mitochondrial transcription rescue factor 1 isoform X3 [Monomorium pharaonis]
MLSRVIVNIIRRSMCNNARLLYRSRDSLHSDFSLCNVNARPQKHCNLYIAKRFKSRKKAADIEKDKDEDSEEEDDDEEAPVGSKVMKIKTNSLRLDLVSKTAFKMSRNKIEEIFYESRFRINGNKVLKKSKENNCDDR